MALVGLWAVEARAEYCNDLGAWVPLGDGPGGEVQAATVMNGELYVAYRMPIANEFELGISKWNGSFWSPVTSFRTRGGNVATMTAYKGELYLGGSLPIDSLFGTSGARGLAKWTGSGWAAVGDGIDGSVQTMQEYNGDLYVGGSIKMAGSVVVRNIARWDGTSWHGFTEAPDGSSVTAMAVWQGSLYVAGDFETIGGAAFSRIARWDGTSWSPLDDRLMGLPKSLAVGDDRLVVSGDLWLIGSQAKQGFPVVAWDGNEWKEYDGLEKAAYGSAIIYNDELYTAGGMALRDTLNWMTGIQTSRWNGTAWERLSSFDDNSVGGRFIEYNGDLLYYGDISSSCGATLNGIAKFCTDRNCALVAGNVYEDVDNNCTREQNERGLARRIVEILPGPYYATTDADGNYARYLDLGSYTVGLTIYKHWQTECPTTPYSVDLTKPGDRSQGNDFAMTPIPGIRDMRVSLGGGRPRPGFQYLLTIYYENTGTVPLNGTIRLEHDPNLTFDSANAKESRYTPNAIEWDITKMPIETSDRITVYLHVPSGLTLGSEVCSYLSIDLDGGGDALLRDNRDSLCQEVRGSYDPNDISVAPTGDPTDEENRLAPGDTILSYLVRFQNTGTDTAFTVVVVDTLDVDRFDAATVEPGAGSHPYTFALDDKGVLTWTFADIMLPDSNVNEQGSHGYLKYTVHLKRGLGANTEIPNRAHIYFDYNSPVVTNTVVSVTAGISSAPEEPQEADRVKIYPNPTSGRLTVEGGSRVVVRTILGEEIARYVGREGAVVELDLGALPTGTYMLGVETKTGTRIERVSVIR